MTPEEDYINTAQEGPYKGQSFAQIAGHDPGYLLRLQDESNEPLFSEELHITLLENQP